MAVCGENPPATCRLPTKRPLMHKATIWKDLTMTHAVTPPFIWWDSSPVLYDGLQKQSCQPANACVAYATISLIFLNYSCISWRDGQKRDRYFLIMSSKHCNIFETNCYQNDLKGSRSCKCEEKCDCWRPGHRSHPILLWNVMQCGAPKTRSIFSKILKKIPQSELWVVFCVLKLWFMFGLSHSYNEVCNIMLYWTAL